MAATTLALAPTGSALANEDVTTASAEVVADEAAQSSPATTDDGYESDSKPAPVKEKDPAPDVESGGGSAGNSNSDDKKDKDDQDSNTETPVDPAPDTDPEPAPVEDTPVQEDVTPVDEYPSLPDDTNSDTDDVPVTTPPPGEVTTPPVVDTPVPTDEVAAEATGSLTKRYDPTRDIVVVTATCDNPTDTALQYKVERLGGSGGPNTGTCAVGASGVALTIEDITRNYITTANPVQEVTFILTIEGQQRDSDQFEVRLSDFGTPDTGGDDDGEQPSDGDDGSGEQPGDDDVSDAKKNNPSYWEGVFAGTDCFKIEPIDNPNYTVTNETLPEGHVYVAAVVKAGSSKSVNNPNEVVRPISAGTVLSHTSDKDISHVILCTKPADSSTPGDGDGDDGSGEQPGDGDDTDGEVPGDGDNGGENPVFVPNPASFSVKEPILPSCFFGYVTATGGYTDVKGGPVQVTLQSRASQAGDWKTEASATLNDKGNGTTFSLKGKSVQPGASRDYRVIASYIGQATFAVLDRFEATRPESCEVPDDGDNEGENPGDGTDDGEIPVYAPDPNNFLGEYYLTDCLFASVLVQGEYIGDGEVSVSLQSYSILSGWTNESTRVVVGGSKDSAFELVGEELALGESRFYRIVVSYTDDQTGEDYLAEFETTRPESCEVPDDGAGDNPGDGVDGGNGGGQPGDGVNSDNPGNNGGNGGGTPKQPHRPHVPQLPLPQLPVQPVTPVADWVYTPPADTYTPPADTYTPPAYNVPVYGDSLPYTGVSGLGQLVAVGGAALLLGIATLVGLRRRRTPQGY